MLPDFQARSGIENLKTTFLLYLIASILILIPLVGFVGLVIELIALIFLIISWRRLGRSGLSEASSYKSTGRWLLWSIIIVIILGIAGTIIIAASLVSSFIASGAFHSFQNGTSPAATTSFFQQSGTFRTFTRELFTLFAVLTAIWIVAWIKMSLSLRRLSSEVSSPRLNATGNLYIIESLVGYTNSIVTYALVISNVSNIPSANSPFTVLLFTSFSGFFLGGFWPFVTLIGLTGTLILIVASYFGYTSLNSYLGHAAIAAPPLPPLTSPAPAAPTLSAPSRTCPQCGQSINIPSSVYCPNCGAKL